MLKFIIFILLSTLKFNLGEIPTVEDIHKMMLEPQKKVHNLEYDETELCANKNKKDLKNYVTDCIEKKHYKPAINILEFLIQDSVVTKKNVKKLLQLANAYYNDGQYSNADDIYTKVFLFIKRNKHIVDEKEITEALYTAVQTIFKIQIPTIGRSLMFCFTDYATRDVSKLLKANKYLKKILKKYPNSAYAKYAKEHIPLIKAVLATHEKHIATFYYNYSNFTAAQRRLSNVIKLRDGVLTYDEKLLQKNILNKQENFCIDPEQIHADYYNHNENYYQKKII